MRAGTLTEPVPALHVLRVFVDEHERGGNPLGVYLDGGQVARTERQARAKDLGFSETVFVDDSDQGEVQIFTPGAEVAMAGHPLVGTSWLLEHEGRGAAVLRPPAGEVATWVEDGATWIRGRPEWAPGFELRQLDSAAAVEGQQVPGDEDALLQVWAWEDEGAGRVRVRVFPRALGIEEDEATGAAALMLAAEVGRPIAIRQGAGSRILARPGQGGSAEIGGFSVLDELRES